MIKLKLLIILLLGIFLYFYLSFFENAFIDDTFITLRYAKTLLESGTWGFFPGYVTNSATSPLNVILLTVVGLFTNTIMTAVKWLALINFMLIFVLLCKISIKVLRTNIFGYMAFSAFLFNPLLLSTIGLEGILFTTLFVASIYFYIEKNWYLLAAMTGLLTITRPEGGLLFVVFLIFVPTVKLRLRFIVVYLLSITPWYIFSWVYLGSLIPDTFFIKTEQKSWEGWDFFNGIVLYYDMFPLEIILSFLFLPLAVLLSNKSIRKLGIIILIIGLVHFAAYSLLQVPPYHWYYVPQVIIIILLGTLALTKSYQHATQMWTKRLLGTLLLFYFLMPAFGMFYLLQKDGYYIKEMPIHTNWATHERYEEMGLWLKKQISGETIQIDGEIGTLAYYSDCYLLDEFSDRRWLKNYINEHTIGWGVRSTLLRINFIFYRGNPEFAPYSYRLSWDIDRELIDNPHVLKWEISSKCTPQGLITLSQP